MTQTVGDLPWVIYHKKNCDESNSSRTYDAASIRHLSKEEQTRYRKDKVDMWLRLREIEHKTSPEAAKLVGIPERTLYS